MADVKVKISSEADVAGFQKVVTQAEKTREAFERLSSVSGKSAADSAKVFQEAARGRQDATDAAGALSAMTAEAKGFSGEVETKAEPNLKKLAKGFKDLTHEVPLLGLAFRALGNPWTFLGAAVAGVVVWFQRMINVQKELAAASAELATRLDPVVVNQIRFQQVMTESAIAADKFNRKLRDQVDAMGAIRDAQRDVNAGLDDRKRLEEAVLEADKKLALAKAGDDPEAKTAVEAEFAGRERHLEFQDNMRRVGLAHQALTHARQLGIESNAQLPGARDALAQAQLAAGKQGDDIDAALGLNKKEGEDLESELKDAIAGKRDPKLQTFFGGEGSTQREKRVRGLITENNQRRDALLARKKQVEAGVAPFAERVAQLEGNVEASRKAVPGLQSDFNRLTGKADTDSDIFEATKGTLAEARKLTTAQAELKQTLKEAAELTRETNREQAAATRELRSMIKANHGR